VTDPAPLLVGLAGVAGVAGVILLSAAWWRYRRAGNAPDADASESRRRPQPSGDGDPMLASLGLDAGEERKAGGTKG
jgi:hypothetical protein